MCSHRFRPWALITYEHMFPQRTSTVGQRPLRVVGLIRSFLMLEDDYEVDWEVGQDEPVEVDHPHRAALRGRAISDRLARRRPGQPAAVSHACVSPVGAGPVFTTGARRKRVARATAGSRGTGCG
jgi:hypothetical protein